MRKLKLKRVLIAAIKFRGIYTSCIYSERKGISISPGTTTPTAVSLKSTTSAVSAKTETSGVSQGTTAGQTSGKTTEAVLSVQPTTARQIKQTTPKIKVKATPREGGIVFF